MYICFLQVVLKGMAWVWNPIILKKFNEGIARTITLMDYCGLKKDIKFICNTFI